MKTVTLACVAALAAAGVVSAQTEGTGTPQDPAAQVLPLPQADGQPTDEAASDAAIVADDTAVAEAEDPVVRVGETELPLDELTGMTVYDANGENIGEISDIVFASAGEAEDAIIDVGGFLGFGEHRVAVPLDAIRIETAENDLMQVTVSMTEEELEAMPEYVPAE